MISRDPRAAQRASYDLAVIGAGIHGASVALEASLRGLSVLLLEREDFGSGASGNSLRILHGGLRYLQRLDLHRFRESVVARRWFAQSFPGLVEPLSCLMPLYGQGMKRRSVMRAALACNDLLSSDRNRAVMPAAGLPGGMTLSGAEVQRRFGRVRPAGLAGGALWYDYRMRSSERVLLEILHRCCSLGARVLNHCEVTEVSTAGSRVTGLRAVDRVSKAPLEFRATRVCNCTGAQARAFAARFAPEQRRLFVPSMAFNVLLECDRLSDSALAVAAPEAGAPVHFLCPAPFGLWAGTEHAGRPDGCTDPGASEAEIVAFLDSLNRAVPSLQVGLAHVRRVYSGLLPVHTAGAVDLTGREAIVDHGRRGGPQGLYSVTGIKFTTARSVAVRAMRAILGARGAQSLDEPAEPHLAVSPSSDFLIDGEIALKMDPDQALRVIREVAAAESVVSAEDFLYRRTGWMFSARDFAPLERLVRSALTMKAIN